jgi:thiol-disulfide isomerase/thioredoxin
LVSLLPVVLFATLALPQAAATPVVPAPAAASGSSQPQVSSAVPLGPGKALWAISPEEASRRASRENKFVFLEFGKEDCGNCKRMDALLYPAFDFEALLISMVPVKIDPDTPLGREFLQRYDIDATPAILITTPEGRLVFLMAGFYNQADFFRHANTAVDSYRQFARRVDSQDISRLPAKEALDTGSELYRRSDPQAALPRLRRAASAPGATTAQREDALEILAAVELDLEQAASSRQTIERLLKTTKDRARRERAEIFRAQIPLAENRPAEALALFRKFQKDHPTSPHIQRVNELVQRLEERAATP